MSGRLYRLNTVFMKNCFWSWNSEYFCQCSFLSCKLSTDQFVFFCVFSIYFKVRKYFGIFFTFRQLTPGLVVYEELVLSSVWRKSYISYYMFEINFKKLKLSSYHQEIVHAKMAVIQNLQLLKEGPDQFYLQIHASANAVIFTAIF